MRRIGLDAGTSASELMDELAAHDGVTIVTEDGAERVAAMPYERFVRLERAVRHDRILLGILRRRANVDEADR